MPVDSTLERPLTNNLDAERSILGAILLDNNALNTAIEALKAEDFFLRSIGTFSSRWYAQRGPAGH